MAEISRQKETADLSSILKSDIFSNLLPGEKQAIIEWIGKIRLKRGELLFSPGKKAEHLYLLLEGHIRVFKPREDGSAIDEIARFAPDDIIGDFDFARKAEYDAYAEALEDSTLVIFPDTGVALEDVARGTPNIISRIFLNSIAMVTGRIKVTRKLIIESMSWVQELHRQIHEDPGTGLWKQSFLQDEIYKYMEDPMALILLKPDRFKVLVDARGHDTGDKVMVKIAGILKNITRRLGRGWALRFKSNETGILINKCDVSLAESLVLSLAAAVADLPPIPLGHGGGDFSFSGSIAWAIWPKDNTSWDSLFEGTYRLLMETWKAGGNKAVRYNKELPL